MIVMPSSPVLFAAWPPLPPLQALACPPTLRLAGASDAAPRCQVGQRVQSGDVLCESLPAAIAPVDGTIVSFEKATLLNGHVAPVLRLQCQSPAPTWPQPMELSADCIRRLDRLVPADLNEWLGRFAVAGIRADRLSSPDLSTQLQSALLRPIDTIICTLLDDPSVRINAFLAARHAAEVAIAARLLRQLTGAPRCWIISDTRTPRSWRQPLHNACGQLGIKPASLRNDYPQAHASLMLYTLLNRRLRPGRLPTDQGVLMLDAAAAIALARCFIADEAMRLVPLAVRNHMVGQNTFWAVPVGAALGDVLSAMGLPDQGVALRAGEVLRDRRLHGDCVIAGAELTVHVSPLSPPINPQPCIRCAWCAQGCPTRVQPAGLLDAVQRGDRRLAERFGLDACIECGICNYVCPSHLPLLSAVRQLKPLE